MGLTATAMTKTCNHNIEIINLLNLVNEEVVTHPILLIKGRLTRKRQKVHESEISLQIVCGDDENETLVKQATQAIDSGEFKFLVDLRKITRDSQLRLVFLYCDISRDLTINYIAQANVCYRLQPLLIVCQEEAIDNCNAICQLIDLNLLLVQCLYAEKLREHGFGRLTFTLNDHCLVFPSQLTRQQAWNSTEDELWHTFGKEILNSSLGDNEKLKFVAFIACTRYDGEVVAATGDYSYSNIRKNLQAHAALGGGGLALFGSAYFYAWPQSFDRISDCFKDDTKVDLAKFPDDSNYRRTHAGVYSTSLGSVCHEIGHIFDLGHTDDGIMGTGFDYLNGVFTLDALTEHLPKRNIKKSVLDAAPRPRFTLLKKRTPTFLEKYHEQRGAGDSFYFTRSCAVILAHHRWLRKDSVVGVSLEPTFNAATQSIIAAAGDALKLIEIRCTCNGLVKMFFEFSTDLPIEPVYCFELPSSTNALWNTHTIFVITVSGCTKTLCFKE